MDLSEFADSPTSTQKRPYAALVGLFTRTKTEPRDYNDPLLGDDAWLSGGERRYSELVSRHYGSPDTIAIGGDERARVGDHAAALSFYQKAIDTLHSIYVCGFNDSGPSSWSRQPSARDTGIADRYLATLQQVKQLRPGSPVESSVKEVTHRLRAISTQFKTYGLNPEPYLTRLDLLASIAPEVDVSGVYWS